METRRCLSLLQTRVFNPPKSYLFLNNLITILIPVRYLYPYVQLHYAILFIHLMQNKITHYKLIYSFIKGFCRQIVSNSESFWLDNSMNNIFNTMQHHSVIKYFQGSTNNIHDQLILFNLLYRTVIYRKYSRFK